MPGIKNLRAAAGVSQVALSHLSGISRGRIQLIEYGAKRPTEEERLRDLLLRAVAAQQWVTTALLKEEGIDGTRG
jgi:DNA-binding transcriptional regulator YiaG